MPTSGLATMPASEPMKRPAADIADFVRALAGSQDPRVRANTPVVPLVTMGLPTRPIAPEHSDVFICAGVIVKIHGTGTDAGRLTRRLHCIGGTDMDRLWIQPLRYVPLPGPHDRLATIWPRVTVLSTVDRPPWTEIGTLLAKLHSMPVQDDPPRLGGHSRLSRAIAWLRHSGLTGWLADIGDELVGALEYPALTTFAHGDFHLGQLGHTPLHRSWKLLDVDDFGIGDPAWDLARTAGFWASGLLDDESWTTFLNAYREAGGPAVAPDGDPWPRLQPVARAAMLVAAVQALRTPTSQDTAAALLDACRRLSTEPSSA